MSMLCCMNIEGNIQIQTIYWDKQYADYKINMLHVKHI